MNGCSCSLVYLLFWSPGLLIIILIITNKYIFDGLGKSLEPKGLGGIHSYFLLWPKFQCLSCDKIFFFPPKEIPLIVVIIILITTNEIPGELSRHNRISSQVKITCYFHTWKDHRCYGYIINSASRSEKAFYWNGLASHWCLYNK